MNQNRSDDTAGSRSRAEPSIGHLRGNTNRPLETCVNKRKGRRLGIWTLVVVAGWVFGPLKLEARDFHVGPHQRLKTPDEVPWEALQPGDRVLIHWRSEPYRTKWVVCRRGTRDKPIVVKGVKGPRGELPVIEGRSAITRPELDFWNEERGVVKIGGANTPPDTVPAYIVVEDLEICGARPPAGFIGRHGVTHYAKNAAAVYVEKGEHIVIRGCYLHDCGNGLFVGPLTSDVVVEHCRIERNGNKGSLYEHNVYTEALGIVFRGNYLGPLLPEARGNNLKDRSAGLVICYNWIEGGNRQLDLVDAEDSQRLRKAPSYRETFVFGNVLIERDGDGNNQIVHYGGDSGDRSWYRAGTLYFYHNTVVSQRSDTTVLFRLSSERERVECYNNVFFSTAPGWYLAVLERQGTAVLGRNWFKRGWKMSHEQQFSGKVLGGKRSLTGRFPGFVSLERGDLHLQPDSPCVNAGLPLPQPVAARHPVRFEFQQPAGVQKRWLDERPDLGAFECVRRR